jgi:hypothetical protein
MLKLTIPGRELFDDEKEEFIETQATTITLEHSLVSLSRWESKWEKSFLATQDKSTEETLDYIRCMILNDEIPDDLLDRLDDEILGKIFEYIDAKMTATTFGDIGNKPAGREIVTAEIIYHWMVAMNVPQEFENWHLSRLITLLKVISAKNAPPKKRSAQDLAARNRQLNAERRAAMNSPG